MARIIAGATSSHVPAIGAAIDNNRTHEPYWQRVFSGFDKTKEWFAKTKPDVVIGVYNDHASAFSVELVPTFALGCASEFPPADEGWGPRQGAGGARAPRSCFAHRAIRHPRRVRSHHLQQDGGRPRPHRADEPDDGHHERRVAVPGDSARGQRRALSAAHRAPLLHARQGDPQGGGILSEGSARRDLRYWRHVAPDFRSARRPDQLQIRQGVPRRSRAQPQEAHQDQACRSDA